MKSGCRPPNTPQHALGQHALGGASFHLLLQISHGGEASCECSIRKAGELASQTKSGLRLAARPVACASCELALRHANWGDAYRLAALYIGRILKGAADLPFQRSTKLE